MTYVFHPRVVKALFLLMLAAPWVVRAVYVDLYIHAFTGARLLGAAQVLANDGVIYAFILGVFYLSFLAKTPRVLAVGLRAIGFMAYGLYAMDVIVLISFNTHITTNDLLDYAGYAPRYIAQISRIRDFLILASALPAVGLSLWVLGSRYALRGRVPHALSLLLVAGLLSTVLFTSNSRYINAWMYRNFVAYNIEVGAESRGYSEGFVRGHPYVEDWRSEPKEAQRPNIIILMVESLSSYHSDYFSRLNDWTPRLDEIARENAAFTNFYASGFCTNDCYIALFTGLPPIRPPASSRFKRRAPFAGFTELSESLPELLKDRGYTTEFLMAGDYDFGEVGPWVDRLGFDHMEGHDHPHYDGWQRYQFESAPDEALYARVVERIQQHGDERYFMFVSTLSTHHPFVNPENGEKSEAQALGYGDRQLGLFYDRLMAMGFFEDGVLIIFGDHHAMVPLKPGEIERFGADRAAAAVPMVLADGGKTRGVVDNLYTQTDIFHSLKNLTGSTRQTSDWAGDIFSDTPAKYAAHRRGDYRDIISVFTQDRDYRVKLDGDETRVVNAEGEWASDEAKREVVGRVNAARVGGREVTTDQVLFR